MKFSPNFLSDHPIPRYSPSLLAASRIFSSELA